MDQFRYFPVEMHLFFLTIVIDYLAQNNGRSFLLGITFGDKKALTVIENLNQTGFAQVAQEIYVGTMWHFEFIYFQ